jgi:hypothetical protein
LRLIELVKGASTWTDDDTIYVARPWSCDADAMLVSPAPNATEPVDRGGKRYDYFLETFIAREVLERVVGPAEERCQRLIDYYAENDA